MTGPDGRSKPLLIDVVKIHRQPGIYIIALPNGDSVGMPNADFESEMNRRMDLLGRGLETTETDYKSAAMEIALKYIGVKSEDNHHE
jgi:hypothetical protein